MGWLIGYTLASMAAAFIVIKIFDAIVAVVFDGATSGLAGIARCILFVATWTAVTARAGMNGFTKRVRRVRQGHTKVIGALIRRVRP